MELVARGERARRRSGEHSRPSRGIALVAAAALLTTLVVAGFAARLPQVAGPVFARWPFAGVGFRAALVALAPGLALVAGAFVLAVRSPRVDAPRIGIWILALASLLLQAGSWEARGPAFDVAARRIENPEVASFYADARAGLDRGAWLSRFDRLPLSAESATHPPGPILFFRALLETAGARSAPVVAAILLALGAAASVLAVAWLARFWGAGERASFLAAALWALLPAQLFFSPQIDQLYPLVTLALLVLAWRLGDGSHRSAALFGLLGAVASFVDYNFLLLPLLFVPLWIYCVRREPARPQRLAAARRLAVSLAIAAGSLAAVQLAFVVASGYRPLASFARAIATQRELIERAARPWLGALGWNLWDFALGAGVVAALFAAAALARAAGRGLHDRQAVLTLLAAAAVVAIDATGLVRGETAHAWLFLQPLWVVPAALELGRYRAPVQAVGLAAQGAVTLAILARLAWGAG